MEGSKEEFWWVTTNWDKCFDNEAERRKVVSTIVWRLSLFYKWNQLVATDIVTMLMNEGNFLPTPRFVLERAYKLYENLA